MTKKTHPTAQRKRARSDEPDDKFIAWIIRTWTWAQQNSQALILGLVSLAVVISGSVYYVNYSRNLEERATTRLESIHQTIGIGQPDAAKEQLAQFLLQFGDTDLASEARLLLGQLHLEQGNPDLALDALEPAASSLQRPIQIQVALLQAAALEESGNSEDAEALYLAVANASDLNFQINEALASAARIRTRNGDLRGAADLYRELLATLDDDHPQRGLFQQRLAEVQAGLDV